MFIHMIISNAKRLNHLERDLDKHIEVTSPKDEFIHQIQSDLYKLKYNP